MDSYVREQLTKHRESLGIQLDDMRERLKAQETFTANMREEADRLEAGIASVTQALEQG